MRNIPDYPTDTDSLEPISRISHGGKDREIHSLSLTRELPSSVHAQVAGLGGITQADGSVDWAAEQDVVESYPTAFNRQGNWPPRTRDSITVDFGYGTITGDLLARALTGFIKDSSGDANEGHSSGVVDPIARLSNRVNLPPLQSVMPPVEDGGEYRHIGLYPTFFTDVAARAARFFSTPAVSESCVFSAPLMGSAWPERGAVIATGRPGSTNSGGQSWSLTPWGMGVANAELTYAPAGDARLIRAMELTAMFSGTGTTQLRISWSFSELKLRCAGSEVQIVHFTGSSDVVVASLPFTDGMVYSARVQPISGELAITLRDATGRQASGSRPRSSDMTDQPSSIRVLSSTPGALIGGAQVSFPSTSWTAVGYTRSAFIGRAAHNQSLTASPPVQNTTARSLLDDQARAELAAAWLDEDGHLQWRNRNELVNGSSVAKLTTTDHVHSLPWEEDFTGVSSKVEVTGRKPEVVSRRRYASLEVWRSNYGKVDANGADEPMEELLHPGTDEDWIMVDTSFNPTVGEVNQLRGSNAVLYYFFEIGERGQGGYSWSEGIRPDWVNARLEFIDHRTYKLTTTVPQISAGGWSEYEFSLKIPGSQQAYNNVLNPQWASSLDGASFPIIRAKATTGWIDVMYSANSGVWDAPVLSHDVGWFVQDPAAVQAIADLLAVATTAPRPFLSDISIIPDPRLQRGDVITLSDPEITGVEFRCLIVGIKDTLTEGGEWSQSLTLRILDYIRISTTLGELDQAWVGQLLSALDAARTGETLAELDAQPLKGAPA